jgi:Raf kinase inhibitor-like YbhB/YbcL family protein
MRLAIPLVFLLTTLPMSAQAMRLTSSDIADGATIAAAQIYPRCGGENVSPALSWSGAPKATKSFALTMIDLDVPPVNWSHWIVVDLPPNTSALARGAKSLPPGAKAIASNFGDAAYDGPCPPAGSGVHHYQITIWALSQPAISFPDNAKATDIAATLQGLALDKASLTGTVSR